LPFVFIDVAFMHIWLCPKAIYFIGLQSGLMSYETIIVRRSEVYIL